VPDSLIFLLYFLAAFLLGSLPLSLWVARLAGKDTRTVGDGNPGATNALKAGGWKLGIAALMLDVSKGALPVGLAWHIFGWRGVEMLPIALAPLLGSAFSPLLNWKGGKSLAVSLGLWIGLVTWHAPLVILPPLTLSFLLIDNAGWAVVAALTALGIYAFLQPEPVFWGVYLIMAVILLAKHAENLQIAPKLRQRK
jgi:acyl phosphate:glycerol-3-phosphate acyltransferase